ATGGERASGRGSGGRAEAERGRSWDPCRWRGRGPGRPEPSAARDIRSRNGHGGLGAVVKGAPERTMGPRPAWPSGPGSRISLPNRPSSLPGAAIVPFDFVAGHTICEHTTIVSVVNTLD